MNSNVNNDKTSSISEQNKDGSLPSVQINPLTLITSITPFNPVDDSQDNVLESTCVNRSQRESTDVNTSLSEKFERMRIKKPALTTHMDEHSIAAWVKSTAAESLASPIERSPSLPSTIIEQITNSRRTSTVSTLCDQQQQQQQNSARSDTLSSTLSQNLSVSTDIQRSFSFPVTADQHQPIGDDIQFIREDPDDDYSSQFLPVPDSEDSEIDKKPNEITSLEDTIRFNPRSPTDETNKSSTFLDNVISFEVPRNFPSDRKRHNSWSTNKNKFLSFQRSLSQKISSQPLSTKLPKINKQYLNSSLQSTDMKNLFNAHNLNQSTSLSDNVFTSASTTNSPASPSPLKLVNNSPISTQFLSIPSSASVFSSSHAASNISDLSGQSGIESSNLRTSTSELRNRAGTIEEEAMDEKTLNLFKQSSPLSAASSRTASTEELVTTSSENEFDMINTKANPLSKVGKTPKTPANQRLDALRQLKWLLDKRSTINPRLNLVRRKQPQGVTPVRNNLINFFT